MLLPLDLVVAILYWSVAGHAESQIKASPWIVAGGTLLIGLLALALTEVATRLTVHFARRHHVAGARLRELNSHVNIGARLLLLLCYLFQVQGLGWPGPLAAGAGEFLRGILGLAPFLVMLALSWICFYKLDALQTPGRWSWGAYISFRLRYTFFVFIPWLLIWAFFDLLRWLGDSGSLPAALDSAVLEHASLLAAMGLTVLLFPLILVHLWVCKPLPPGPLLTRLRDLETQAGVRFSQVFVWHLGGNSMLNGAVLGFVHPFRYLLLSRGLLDHLTPEEVAGVVAHELGHVRYRHLLWYLFFTATFVMGSYQVFASWLTDLHLLALALGLAIAFYFRFIFGGLSRHFERQADAYAVDLLGTARPLISSLEKIGLLSGNIRDARCWHHSSIAQRVRYLEYVAEHPERRAAHHALCARLRRGLGLIGACIIATVVYAHISRPVRPTPPAARAEPFALHGHWQRVTDLIPTDAEAWLHLAELGLTQQAPPADCTPEAIQTFLDEAVARSQDAALKERAAELRQLLAARRAR